MADTATTTATDSATTTATTTTTPTGDSTATTGATTGATTATGDTTTTATATAAKPEVPADYEDIKRKLADYETAEEARKNAALSETEKARKDADDAAARATALETKLVKRDALDALKAANVIDPDLAYLAIKEQIKVKDGEGENIKALVEQFVKDRPAMVKAATTAAPQTHSTNGGSTTTASTGRDRIPGKI